MKVRSKRGAPRDGDGSGKERGRLGTVIPSRVGGAFPPRAPVQPWTCQGQARKRKVRSKANAWYVLS